MSFHLSFLLLPFLCGLSSSSSFHPPSSAVPLTPTIYTPSGPIIGRVLNPQTNVFLGIPFAAPPIDDLRWRPPTPHQPWQSALYAFEYGACCTQGQIAGAVNVTYEPQSEDCLTLNIWAPSNATSASLLPVLVFVHGGGFLVGCSKDDVLNGTSLSENGPAIVVTINYRLGAFGFLALRELVEEDPNNSTGMYGMMDQQEALRWVQKNIQSFGGDPDRVMLFGQSAGGNSMVIHLVSPVSAKLFSSIVIESGYYRGYYALPNGFNTGQHLITASGCNSSSSSSSDLMSCLRSLSTSQVLDDTDTCQWLPVIDGYVLPAYADTLVEKGDYNHVPVIIGGTRNEGTITVDLIFGDDFSDALYPTYTLALYTPLVGALEANRVIKEYRPDQYESPYWCLSASFGDFNILCSSAYFATLLIQKGTPVYLYVFSYPPSSNGFYPTPDPLGAYHAAEIPFIWHTFFNFTTSEDVLSSQIQTAWLNFAKDHTPGSISGLNWPVWGSESEFVSFEWDAPSNYLIPYMGIGDRCVFWDKQPLYSPQVLLGGCT